MGDGGRLAKSWCGELEEVGNLANDDEFAIKDFHILRKLYCHSNCI